MATPKLFDTEQNSGISLLVFNKSYRYWLLLRRFWWILAVTIIVSTLIFLYKIHQTPTQYVTKGRMMVSARLNLPEGVSYSEELANFFGTQIEIMQSTEVLDEAKKRLKYEHPKVEGVARVFATQVPKTSIFELEAKGTDAEYTRLFLDAIMEEFIDFKRDKRQETSYAAISQLTTELARLKKEQEQQQEDLFAFKKKYNLSYLEAQGNAGTQYLSELRNQEARLKTKLKFLENLSMQEAVSTSSVPDTQALSVEGSPISPQEVTNSGLLEELPVNEVFRKEYYDTQKQLLKSQIVLDDLLRVLTPEHPKVKAIQEDINRLQGFVNLLLYRNLEIAKSNINVLKKQLQTIQSSIKEWEENVLHSSQIQAEYEMLDMSLERTKSLYSSLLASVQRLEITENVNVESIQILQKADAAKEASRRWVLGFFEGILMGILIGGVIIVLIDVFDDRIISSLDVEANFSEPLLTQIPQLNLDGEEGPSALLQLNEKRLPYAESFRNLRSSILFRQENQQLKTIIICSTLPNEGKSSIATNLAITMAQTGEKILLIDGDLRRGNMTKSLGYENQPGLTEAIDDIRNWEKYVIESQYPNLHVIGLGKQPQQPGELFLRPSLDLLITQAKQHYDRIIFDSAPLLAVTDSASLAPKLDAVIMIVRSAITSREKAKQALQTLQSRQANIFGIVMNGVDAFAPGYGYYRYKGYYY